MFGCSIRKLLSFEIIHKQKKNVESCPLFQASPRRSALHLLLTSSSLSPVEMLPEMVVRKKSRQGKPSGEVAGREVNEPRVKSNNRQPKSKLRSGNYMPLTLQLLVLKLGRENELERHKRAFKRANVQVV